MTEKKITVFTAALFVVLIFSGLIYSILNRFGINGGYNELFSSKEISLDFFSMTQRILGKRETRNFEVLKSKDGMLYLQDSGWPDDEQTLNQIAAQYEILCNTTEKCGGKFLFVQIPYKNAGQAEELKYYSDDNTEQVEDRLLDLLRNQDIDTLDLRKNSFCTEYYKTDHHWTAGAGFHSARIISEYLWKEYKVELGDTVIYGDLQNYAEVKYENALLGSIGIKVGPYFTGRDDFIIYNPLFDTNMEMTHYIHGEKDFCHVGDFWNVCIDQTKLDDKKYNNKYVALAYGAWSESIFKNYKSNNDCKILLVTHSYGRALAPYLSLYCSELRYLDPQPGRYNDSYVKYINDYRPDVVIVAFNGLLNVED